MKHVRILLLLFFFAPGIPPLPAQTPESILQETNLAICNIFQIRFLHHCKSGEWEEAEQTAWQMHLLAKRMKGRAVRKNNATVCHRLREEPAEEAGEILRRWIRKMEQEGDPVCLADAHLHYGIRLLLRSPAAREQARREAEWFLSSGTALPFPSLVSFASQAASFFPEEAERYADAVRTRAKNSAEQFRADRILFDVRIRTGKTGEALRLADERIRAAQKLSVRKKWLKLRLRKTPPPEREAYREKLLAEAEDDVWKETVRKTFREP